MRTSPLMALALVLVACSEPDISQDVRDYADELSVAEDLACQCPSALGFGTVSECGASYGVVADRYDCMESALQEQDDAKAFLDCAGSAARSFADCLTTSVDDGCEQTQHLACIESFEDAVLQCPGVTGSAASDFLGCES